nr:PREDICTED: transport and Golgi organization protein 1 isoform X1 [Megachile rotundata]
MTKRNLFINTLFLVIAIIFSAISQCSSALSNKRLCYNPDCSEPVSLARTTIKYAPNEPGLLKFDISAEVKVYSKEAGNRTDLWGVEINGKRGYVPKSFLKEYKIIHKNLKYEVPINQLSNNVVSNEKPQPKEDNDKSVFDTKDIKVSNVETDNLDLKSTEELPHNVTSSHENIDGITFHLNHDEPSVSSSPTEVVEKAVVPNKEDAVDNSKINSNNNKNELNIFTKDTKLPQELSNDELNVEEHSPSNKLNIKHFITNSEETFNLSDETEVVHDPSLNITENVEKKTDDEVENLNNNSSPVKDALISKSDIDMSVSQTLSNDVKETLTNKDEIVAEQNNTDNVESNKTDLINDINIPVESTESINISNEKDALLSNIDTLLEAEQNELEKENKHSEDLNNVSLPLETNTTDTVKVTLPSESAEESEKHANKFDKIDDKLLENNKELTIEQSQLKEKARSTEDLSKYNNVASLILKSSAKNTAELTLSSDTKKDEESKEINLKTEYEKTLSDTENAKLDVISEAEMAPFISQDSNLTFKEDNIPPLSMEENNQELEKTQSVLQETHHDTKEASEMVNETVTERNEMVTETIEEIIEMVNETIQDTTEVANETTKGDDSSENVLDASNSVDTPHVADKVLETESDLELPKQLLYSDGKDVISENMNINEFRNRNLLNVETTSQVEIVEDVAKDETDNMMDKDLVEDKNNKITENEILDENLNTDTESVTELTSENLHEIQATSTPNICIADNVECSTQDNIQNDYIHEDTFQLKENAIMEGIKVEQSYWLTLIYLSVTATAILIFSLGYYYIENMRRDRQLIAKVNKLEKDLLVATKECAMLNENLKITKDKLTCIEDESFGSNEMVLSLKADLEASQNARAELEDQVTILEKDLESATEAGLELERMLREVLSSNNEVNPLAQSVEDLQTRLNAQQTANESLKNALHLKTQENESLSTKLATVKKEYEELEVELSRVTENLKLEKDSKNCLEQTLTDKVQQLEMQIKEISTEKTTLQKKLKEKEIERKDLLEVINRLNSNNLDLDKLYDVLHIKAEATALLEERNELKIRLVEVEGAHHLLEEHMNAVKEEIATLSEQCKIAEKEKKDAETRLEVLTNFFEEKEAQRQKEEAIWLQQQGEVVSTVERIQTMQNEIQNYKQQIEMLKREILDQEREYKNQISVLETKAHEQWVLARQVERRLEESKVEAGQLRNRLTLIEKNINDADSEAKLHRLEANGETTTSPPLFIGAESSNSPIMFSGSSNVPPPPPPSYLHSLFPPYLPPPLPNTSGVPPYEVSQRPAPLGGRLSSPPPMPLHPSASSRYNNAGSPPPPMSSHLLPPFNHRSPPPPPFGSDIHPPPPHPPGSILPPPLGTSRLWGEESLPPPRNSGFHPPQRERVRNHKGSLHSSGESLDKTHHNSKV